MESLLNPKTSKVDNEKSSSEEEEEKDEKEEDEDNKFPDNVSPNKKIVFSEINNRIKGSEIKKNSMISNSVLKKSFDTKNNLDFKQMIKKLNGMQSPQFEIKKNNSTALTGMYKFFKTDSYLPEEASVKRKKWFTEGYQNKNLNIETKGSSFLKKIFMEKSLSKSQADNKPFSKEKKLTRSKKIKNKSFCKEAQNSEKINLFKSHVMLHNERSFEEFKSKSKNSSKTPNSKSNHSQSEMSLVYTRKIKQTEQGHPIHLDSFRKICKDSPTKKEDAIKDYPQKNIFKWQSGSIDSFTQNQSKASNPPPKIDPKMNTKTPEFVKPSKLSKHPKFILSSNQVLFSPKFNNEEEASMSEVQLKGTSLNVSLNHNKKIGSQTLLPKKLKFDFNHLVNPKEDKYSVMEKARERKEGLKGKYSLMFTHLLGRSKNKSLKNVKNKKSKSLLKIVDRKRLENKLKMGRQSDLNKNKSAVLENNWEHLKKIIDPSEELKRKYRTNDNVKSNKKKSKCRSLLPSQKLDTSEDEYNKKLTSFFQSKPTDPEENFPLMEYESCKSQSMNDLANIEADIQIPDFVNVYTEEVSQDAQTQLQRHTGQSNSREMEERVTRNKYAKKGKIQISKDLLQHLKSNEDNFSSQTVTSNKKNRPFKKGSFKSNTIKEILGKKNSKNHMRKQKTQNQNQAIKKIKIEARYKSNQNPSKVDFSKYGSFKNSSDQLGTNFKSFTQKLNLKKFIGSKQFINKDLEQESQKRTSSAMISSDGFNISRKYSSKQQEQLFNGAYKKSSQQNSNKRQKIFSEMNSKVLDRDPKQEGRPKQYTLGKQTSIENNEVRANASRNSENYKKKNFNQSSYEKSLVDVNSKKYIKRKKYKKNNLKSKPLPTSLKKYNILTSLKLPPGITESLKMTPINQRRRPPKKFKNKPPKLPNKSKTTKNKFYESELNFEKRNLFKSKMNYIEKKDKKINRRITDLNQKMEHNIDLKRGYTSGGIIKMRATPSNTSKNFSKRSNLKYELNYPKSHVNKITMNSKESNLFSNEHNFIGSGSKKGNKNFNSHQVSKKNNDPGDLDKETSLTSSEIQKKYFINFDGSTNNPKSKNINNIPEDSFRKNSKLASDKHNKTNRKDFKKKEQKRSKKNNYIKFQPQNVSNTSNSKISNSKPMDNFSQQISRKKRKRFQKHIKSGKNTHLKPKVPKKNFKSNRSGLNINNQITPTLTSIDVEPFESINSPEDYTLEDTNNIYIENYMRNVRENKSKKRKKSSKTYKNIKQIKEDVSLTNYLDHTPQKFPNIYNITNKKKKKSSRMNNEVNSTSNLRSKKDYNSQSSFYNMSKKNFDSKTTTSLTPEHQEIFMNQTSKAEKDFKRKSDLSYYKDMEVVQVPLQTFSKSILQKKQKIGLPISQSNSLFFSKNNLTNTSLNYESPSQKSLNFAHENFKFPQSYNLLSKKKKKQANKKRKNE